MAMTIAAEALRQALVGTGELALVDVREEGVFGARHILLAVNVALSRIELEFRDLVPRKGTPVVLVDADDGLAARAAEWLARAGYTDIAILAGGVEGWAAAGFELFSGVNVPSKVFGEHVEHHCGTPSIAAEELQARIDAGEKIVILDSRPMDEFHRMNIPGGIDVPGAELAYRIHDLAPDPDTTVVVNCAGRTRSIIGAQSLINAGIPNKVVALRNGTMGWHLAGLKLERGATRSYGPLSMEAKEKARAAAARVRDRYDVRGIDAAALRRFQAESDDRTLYLLDVRAPDEFAAGHIAGSRHAPGGQLIQTTDRYIATRNARIVLVDDAVGVRATMTASWLVQMGWPEVYMLDGGVEDWPLTAAAADSEVPELAAAVQTVTAAELQRRRDNFAVVDVGDSLSYRNGHIPGAWWAIRARLKQDAAHLPAVGEYCATCGDGRLARLAAADLAALTGKPAVALEGGNAAWKAAGLPLAEGLDNLASATDDIYHKPYDRAGPVEQWMQQYLSWEIELINQIERDGTMRFPTFPR